MFSPFFLTSLVISCFVCALADQIAVITPSNTSRTALIHPASTASIPLRYHCTNISATVCLEVHQLGVGAVLESTCMLCSQNDHTLNNIAVGRFEIILRMVDETQTPFELHQFFEVVTIENGAPDILVPSEVELLAVPPLFSADLSIKYNLIGAAQNVIKQIEVCIDLEKVSDGAVALPQTCVRSDHNVIGLNAIPEGDYRLSLVCRTAYAPYSVFAATEKVIYVHIHRSSAFIPTYEWQRVHAWESIPTGLEVRLPIGEAGGQKVAKIPEPWRLQLPLPSPPCKYFLRMEIFKHTTTSDIINGAAANCKLRPECFGFFVGERDVTSGEAPFLTSQELDLFQSSLSIEILPQCQEE